MGRKTHWFQDQSLNATSDQRPLDKQELQENTISNSRFHV